MILNYAHAHGKITRSEAADLCHLSIFQASRFLRQISKKHKQIQIVGRGRGTHYVWKETKNERETSALVFRFIIIERTQLSLVSSFLLPVSLFIAGSISMCVIEEKKLDESRHFVTFPSVSPIVEGHLLIVPKKHYYSLRDIELSLVNELLDVAAEVSRKLLISA